MTAFGLITQHESFRIEHWLILLFLPGKVCSDLFDNHQTCGWKNNGYDVIESNSWAIYQRKIKCNVLTSKFNSFVAVPISICQNITSLYTVYFVTKYLSNMIHAHICRLLLFSSIYSTKATAICGLQLSWNKYLKKIIFA